MSGHEDDWGIAFCRSQGVLQCDAGRSGQLHIQDQARSIIQGVRRQEFPADPKSSTAYPADSMQSLSLRRTSGSSSTIAIWPFNLCSSVLVRPSAGKDTLLSSNGNRVWSGTLFYFGRKTRGVCGKICSFSAMRTKSARESARILRITFPRCALIVTSVVPNSPAICLFSNPATISVKTCRSVA